MLVRSYFNPVGYTIVTAKESIEKSFSLDWAIEYPYEYNENVDSYNLVKENVFLQVGLFETIKFLCAGISPKAIGVDFILGQNQDEALISEAFSFLLKTFLNVHILEVDEKIMGFWCERVRDEGCKDLFNSLFSKGELNELLQSAYKPTVDKGMFEFWRKHTSYEYVSENVKVKKNEIIDYYKTICKKYDEPFYFSAHGFEKSELESLEWFNNLMASFKRAIADFYIIDDKEILISILLSEETEKQDEYRRELEKQMGF